MRKYLLTIFCLFVFLFGEGQLFAQSNDSVRRPRYISPLAAARQARIDDSIAAVRLAEAQAKAAADSIAMNDLHQGDLYYYGEQVKINYVEAVKWYRKAADQGLAYAQYKLGTCYYYGIGVQRNPTEARKWFQMASDQGHKDANRFLTIPGR